MSTVLAIPGVERSTVVAAVLQIPPLVLACHLVHTNFITEVRSASVVTISLFGVVRILISIDRKGREAGPAAHPSAAHNIERQLAAASPEHISPGHRNPIRRRRRRKRSRRRRTRTRGSTPVGNTGAAVLRTLRRFGRLDA